jgi:transcriptional regulator with XRE-family HTH domain
MAKKMQRVFRDRHLTSEEIERDEQVRREVEQEFPPRHDRAASSSSSLSELLKHSIRESDKSIESIASDTGVSPILIERFLSGERDIHMTTADRLADALGLKLATD